MKVALQKVVKTKLSLPIAIVLGVLAPFALPAGAAEAIAGAARRGQRRRERALSFGRPVQAKVTSVYFDTTLRVNGRSPWVIAATFDDSSGRKLEFKSERLWYDPTPYYPNGSEVTVYFLDDDPRVNAFQLDKLPEGYNA